ncbi:MAG TPA: hypothetical protein VIO94_14290, partial [Phenylobacterium sp.]
MHDDMVMAAPAFLAGGGEMGERIRRFEWRTTPLGPPEGWPVALRTAAGIVLASTQPTAVWWGEDLIQVFNDAWAASSGAAQARGLGRPAAESW